MERIDADATRETLVKRIEGLSKLTGAERYVADLPVAGCLWGATVRSPAARGRIVGVHFDASVDWSRLIVVDHRDIPGPNEVRLIETDQPVLAVDRVRHVGEPILLLAGESRSELRRALSAIRVTIDPDEPMLDYRAAPSPEQIQFDHDNVFKRIEVHKGDVDKALADAPHVIEGVYETGAQEHAYIEPQGMIAREIDGVLTVTGSLQCPYYVLGGLMHALGMDQAQLRVVQLPTGGAFGGKEEYPTIIAIHAALLALKARRPVRLLYDRAEDMAATTKRHPARVRHRTAVDHDGRLLAQDIDITMDAGAYVTLSPVVLSRGVIHGAGPYACDNVRIVGRAVMTNHVPYGAFRGFGAPQTHFANERHMDRIAGAIGVDPVTLRRTNLLREGQTTATGQVIRDGADRVGLLDRAVEVFHVEQRRSANESFNATHPYLRRGVGLSYVHHGAGFTGAGEVELASRIALEAHADGRVEVLSAQTEMGQGMRTVFTQIASEALGYVPGDVVIAEPDTARVPDSGPTVASRTSMVVGRLIERAVDDLRQRLGLGAGVRGDAVKRAVIDWYTRNPGATLRVEARYQPPPGVHWDEQTYTGDAYGVFAWACNVAEVEVDLRTWAVRVVGFHARQEVGRVLNETLARGQIRGGVLQAIGWALSEQCIDRDGALANARLTDYIIPTADDHGPIDVAFEQTPYPHGAMGAKGIGELPMDGPAPAIAGAVADAIGADPHTIPILPERLMELARDESPA